MPMPSESPTPALRNTAWLGRLKPLKGVIVGIAGVGAVLSGLVGYYTTYKAVAEPPAGARAPSAPSIQGLNSKSIAVLPFANMSGDPSQEFFSDGISEELINQLSKINDLLVIARTSSFSFKGKALQLAQIGTELNVAHILQGSIRRAGNKVRITAQLIRAADSIQIWSETYDRDLTDIFAVQDEISGAVVEQLKVKLLGAAPKAQVVNTEAYALLMQGRAVGRQNTAKGYKLAIDLFTQALQIDPKLSAAWVALSIAYISQAEQGLRPIEESARLAREAVGHALAIDPASANASSQLALIAREADGDLALATQHLNRALALAPEDPAVLRDAALLSRSLGKESESLAVNAWLARRDPTNPSTHSNLFSNFYALGRLDDALASIRKTLALAPSGLASHYCAAMVLLAQGKPKLALVELRLESESSAYLAIGLPMVWHALGDKRQSDASLAELIRSHGEDAAYNIAAVYAHRSEADNAFEWLSRAVRTSDPGLAYVVTDPELAKLHADARWLPFLRRIGRAPEQLAGIQLDVKLPAR